MYLDVRTHFFRSLTFDLGARPLFWHMYGLMPGVLKRWHTEGLPLSVDETKIHKYFKFDGHWQSEMAAKNGTFLPVNLPFPVGLDPPFERQVLEETERHLIYIDEFRLVKKMIKGISTLPITIDHPIKNPSEWPRFRKRLQFTERRLKGKGCWLKQYDELRDHGLPVFVNLIGFFWFPRDLMGEVMLSCAYHRNPDLVRDILDTYSDLIISVAERMLSSNKIDAVIFNEDMAYKRGPMISPRIFKEFMLPYYVKVINLLKHKGARIFCVDTDGNIEILIPLFIEAGVNVIGPVEVQAGMDLVKMRKRYGSKMAYFGGIDKRALAKDFKAIDVELERKLPFMLKTGGYLVGLDHRVLAETSFRSFQYYVGRVRGMLGCTN